MPRAMTRPLNPGRRTGPLFAVPAEDALFQAVKSYQARREVHRPNPAADALFQAVQAFNRRRALA